MVSENFKAGPGLGNYPLQTSRQKQQRIGVPAELVKDYEIVLLKDNREVRKISVEGNHLRHRIHKFENTPCDAVELRVKSTNGAENIVVFEARAYEKE